MLRVFIDSDVLIAGSASPAEHPSGSASLIILTLSELSLIEAVISQQVMRECQENLEEKLPEAVTVFERLVGAAVTIVPDPSRAEIDHVRRMAHEKDVPLLAAALREQCAYLATFNVTDYEPGHPDVEIIPPGRLVRRIRDYLAFLR